MREGISSSSSLPSLKSLLQAADLLSFEMPLTCELHLRHAGDIEFVDENDLLAIGMSRPEQKRLRKEYMRMFPKASVLGKLKKVLTRDDNKRLEDRPVEQQHVIPIDRITLSKELGNGEFGTVHMAYWMNSSNSNESIKVAVKCVSSEKLLSNPSSFLAEAAIMHRMHHDDVVKLYGVVLDTKQIMIVSELASSGSLQACLLNPSLRDSFPVQVLCNFAIQIARGMAYLESQRLIHRDLAARNVLVFSATKVKISDFGLSRSLGVGEDYYRSDFSPSLRLPIAWCAPECINFLKFTHSSDVWAYGVTLWEMFSYGRMPYEGMTGAEILNYIDKQRRYAFPREDMYQLMCECWTHNPLSRPSFSALLAQLPDRLPLHVRAVVTRSQASTADHLVYNKDDFIYVIDKNLDECPDGSLWLGSLKNGKTGLFDPNDTVAHLGAEPPASNKSEEKKEEKGKKSKVKEGKESTRERMKLLISQPQAVVHKAHLGIDGSYFGLLQMDKKDLQPCNSPVPSHGDLSPSSLHSSLSTCSSSSHAQQSDSTLLSPSIHSFSQPSPQPPLPPRINRSRQREPTAPPLTPELSDGCSGSEDTMSVDTVIGIKRGSPSSRLPPIHAVYARRSEEGVTWEGDPDPLLERLEEAQRDLTDFSLSSMATSTTSDTHPLIRKDEKKSHPSHSLSWNFDKAAVRLMKEEEMERLEEKAKKEHRKVDKELYGSRTHSLVVPTAPPISDASLKGMKREPHEWTKEAQEAYRLVVDCGVSLRQSASPSPSHSPSHNGITNSSVPSLPPRSSTETQLPPALPPKKNKTFASNGRDNYDNLNGITNGLNGKKAPPPVPPKPKMRTVIRGDSEKEAMELSPSCATVPDDYRTQFVSAVSQSSLLPKNSQQEVLRF